MWTVKNLGKSLPIAVVFFILFTSVAMAYVLVWVTGSVIVTEAIDVSPTSFSMDLKPAENKTRDITLTNSANVDILVGFDVTIGGNYPLLLDVICPTTTMVMAGEITVITCTIEADAGLPPGEYAITIAISR